MLQMIVVFIGMFAVGLLVFLVAWKQDKKPAGKGDSPRQSGTADERR